MPKFLCPYCKEPLVVRCYYEQWLDYEAVPSLDGKSLDIDDSNEPVDFSVNDNYGPDIMSYECSKCKRDIDHLIGETMENLKEEYPAMFVKGGDDK